MVYGCVVRPVYPVGGGADEHGFVGVGADERDIEAVVEDLWSAKNGND